MNQVITSLPIDFFWKNYLYQHPDLINAYGDDQEKIEEHYLNHGFFEHRPYKSKISLVVCCMNRVDNLISTLSSWINTKLIHDIVVVDYSSTNPLNENEHIKILINENIINLITVKDEKYFNQGKAYNLAIDFAKNDILIKIDADHICKNGDWIKYLYHPNFIDYYLVCDYKLCFSDDGGLSGFWAMYKKNFIGYKEDLNNYGYDDIDLYNRLDREKKSKKIIFFDIENYIEHISHADELRTNNYQNQNKIYTNTQNEILCSAINENQYRQKYNILTNNNIVYKKINNQLDKIYCINLDNRKDRWAKLSHNKNIFRYSAQNQQSVTDDSLLLNPVGMSAYIYFNMYPNAFYTYLSHYSVWNDIIDNNISYALVLEDDIDPNSIDDLINSNLDIGEFDYIQLSQRFINKQTDLINNKYRTIFNGGESYILNRHTAIKLVSATHFPIYLKEIIPHEHDNIINFLDKYNYSNIINWPSINSITSPVDKFMGYCCEAKSLCINSYNYPIISQDKLASLVSDITNETDMNTLPDNKLEKFYQDFKYHTNYT